jgi:transposase InsO family protein
MKIWWTRPEMIAAELPGLGSNAAISRVAKQLNWAANSDKQRKRAGRGGGTEIHISLMPEAARLKAASFELGQTEISQDTKREVARYDAGHDLAPHEKEERDARLTILTMVDKLAEASNLSFRAAACRFVDLYNARAITIENWLIETKSKLSLRTVLRWQKLKNEGDFKALAGSMKGQRANTGILDTANNGEVKTYVLALIAKQPHLTAKPIRAAVVKKFSDSLEMLDDQTGEINYKPCPALRTFQETIKKWKAEYHNTLVRLTNPDKYKGSIRMVFAGGASAHVQRLNQLWEIDASPADVMTKERKRRNIYACVDVWSRRAIILVTETPRAEAVGLLVRDAIKAWGLPEAIKTDNGSDFIAKSTKRLFSALGIEHLICDPFSPEQKPHVERFIGTYQRGFTSLLPGFLGHNVAQRSVIEGRKSFSKRLGTAADEIFEVDLTAEELQEHSTMWVERVYHHEPHSGLNGITPAERAASYGGNLSDVDPQALDILLAPIPSSGGLRRVTKSGIRLNSECYLIGNVPVGETVFCRMDPRDMGKIYVFDEEGETYFGEAISPVLSGLDPKQAIMETRKLQKAIEDEQLTPIRKEMRKIKPRDVVTAVLDREIQEKVVSFPREKTTISTPELDAASATVSKLKPAPVDAELAAMMAEINAELGQPAAPEKPNSESVTPINRDTDWQRFKRAKELEARIHEGQPVTEKDLNWLKGYRDSPEYETLSIMEADFGAFRSK